MSNVVASTVDKSGSPSSTHSKPALSKFHEARNWICTWFFSKRMDRVKKWRERTTKRRNKTGKYEVNSCQNTVQKRSRLRACTADNDYVRFEQVTAKLLIESIIECTIASESLKKSDYLGREPSPCTLCYRYLHLNYVFDISYRSFFNAQHVRIL